MQFIPPGIKKLSSDFILNLFASLVSTGVLQLLVYPKLAISLGPEGYGEMLTIMGIVNIIILSFGNNLCNARIVQQPKYRENVLLGDFQLLAIIASVLCGVIVLSANAYFKLPLLLLVGLIVATILQVLKSYYLVAYRIVIDYKKNLWANVFLATGYIIGAFILLRFFNWTIVFILSALFCLGYITVSSSIIKEPVRRTKLFGNSSKTFILLLLSGIIANVTTYLDRFLLYPTLGPESVSTYTTAAFFAKSLSLILLPMTSVILSYLSAGRIQMNRNRFITINVCLIVFSLIFLVISVSLGYWITKLLYPTLIDNANQYFFSASVGIIINLICSFTGVVLLAIAPSFWQVVLSGFKLGLYLLLGIVLINTMGLLGLCTAIILTNTIYFILIFFIGNYYLN